MEYLFYSEAEKIAFYIPNYYPDQSSRVDEIIKVVTEGKTFLIDELNKELLEFMPKEVRTEYISKSDRYKSMRVWWVPVNKCPSTAFKLGSDWTMNSWIKGNAQ